MKRERGLVLIIAYKLIKGVLWFIIASVLLVMMHMGLSAKLEGAAENLRHHSQAWAIELAELLTRASTPRGLVTIVVALFADGTLTLVEGWALIYGHWWGPWLVVVATSSLLPFEVVSFVRHPHVGRALILVVNLAIVVYLARQALREHRARAHLR
ncbi:MAG TPA: DUF2127 domain-containing protein [Polyangiaceae bacterium]|nr:DUF2127 domain-containing protein [Polyangiaceae bacterium]